jgi:hypothetical protein
MIGLLQCCPECFPGRAVPGIGLVGFLQLLLMNTILLLLCVPALADDLKHARLAVRFVPCHQEVLRKGTNSEHHKCAQNGKQVSPPDMYSSTFTIEGSTRTLCNTRSASLSRRYQVPSPPKTELYQWRIIQTGVLDPDSDNFSRSC